MGEEGLSGSGQGDFEARREKGRQMADALDRNALVSPSRQEFFNSVYRQAGDDAALVPWADLKPKDQLIQWLEENAGISSASPSSTAIRAIDIACGLGDNAEAIAAAGYETTAFDLSHDAIEWARQRFPQSEVDYHVADLFALPEEWLGAFDLVHECFTLQALPPETVPDTAHAIAALVAPAGRLLVYTRWRQDGADADGPPWPLEETALGIFSKLGLELTEDKRFEVERPGRVIPIAFMEWKRPA